MTIPQLFSAVGWPVFAFSAIFLLLHTINLFIPAVDFIIPSSRIGLWGYLICVPLLLFGLVVGVIGFFAEQIHEAWLDRQNER